MTQTLDHQAEGQQEAGGKHPLERINPCRSMDDVHILARLAAEHDGKRKLAVASAAEAHVVEAVAEATKADLVTPYFFGDADSVQALCEQYGLNPSPEQVQHASSKEEAGRQAVQAVADGRCDVLMKGQIQTAMLMHEVFKKDYGLRGDKRLSHIIAFDSPHFDRLFLLSDVAINIDPDLNLKLDIVNNAVHVAHLLGIRKPYVAMLAAVETVDPHQQTSLNDAIIAKMADRDQIRGAYVDGPLALDNAIDRRAAELKNIRSDVAGRADVLIVDNIDVGNVFYKSLIYFARVPAAGVVAGMRVPMILTSRADSSETKLNSIALACAMAAREPYVAS